MQKLYLNPTFPHINQSISLDTEQSFFISVFIERTTQKSGYIFGPSLTDCYFFTMAQTIYSKWLLYTLQFNHGELTECHRCWW